MQNNAVGCVRKYGCPVKVWIHVEAGIQMINTTFQAVISSVERQEELGRLEL